MMIDRPGLIGVGRILTFVATSKGSITSLPLLAATAQQCLGDEGRVRNAAPTYCRPTGKRLLSSMLSGPRKVFCDGIVAGKPTTEAYRAAYPRATPEGARKHASRLKARADVREEIARLRRLADEKAGSAVMQCVEKRMFLAQLVRARVSDLPDDSDLFQSIKQGKGFVERKLPDKLAAIQLDSKLAGEGNPNEAADQLAAMLRRCLQ